MKLPYLNSLYLSNSKTKYYDTEQHWIKRK
jgi:hypothetical protein